ncbi:MAG TPA: glucose-1-phosphate cytidylyltransferase [Deltaproteobacteria bacterium]|nr:glucose-1-phosphate cytidylyltransferase [Deltaproteobacteria bacterium]
MQVVILCGGMGTRLKEETEFRPKPMVEIGGKPILWHIMKIYSHYGFKEFILCLGYKGSIIKEYFLNYEYMTNDFTIELGSEKSITVHNARNNHDWKVTLAETGLDTLTGGRIKRIEKYIEGDTFFATYGDGLADIDIRELLAFHRRSGKTATLTGFHPISRFGVIEVDKDYTVERFREKPRLDGLISGGFFVFNRKIFDYIDGDDSILERQPMHRLAEERQLAMYHHQGFWHSMDTYRDFLDLNRMWEEGKTPWKVWNDD